MLVTRLSGSISHVSTQQHQSQAQLPSGNKGCSSPPKEAHINSQHSPLLTAPHPPSQLRGPGSAPMPCRPLSAEPSGVAWGFHHLLFWPPHTPAPPHCPVPQQVRLDENLESRASSWGPGPNSTSSGPPSAGPPLATRRRQSAGRASGLQPLGR